MSDERSCWSEVTQIMAADEIRLDRRTSDWFDRAPQRVLKQSSHYKFAAKMLGQGKRVLDVGCRDGLGTWILAAECGYAVGVDPDEIVISIAQSNWTDPRVAFVRGEMAELPPGPWDGVVCLDVLSQISPAAAQRFLSRVCQGLAHDGMAIVGAPHVASQQYVPDVAEQETANAYSGERLEAEMHRHFRHVFMFGAYDEVVQPGFSPRFSDLFAVGCRKLS